MTTLAGSIPMTDLATAYDLRTAEIDAWTTLLGDLKPSDWDKPTVCAAWSVGDIVRHLVSQAEEQIWPWQFPLRDRKATKAYPELPQLDAHMRYGADLHRTKSQEEIIEYFLRVWPRANRAIRRCPAIIRHVGVSSEDANFGTFRITLAEIYDVLLPRDLWMHRDDVSRAIGQPTRVAEHDLLVVDQIMRDLHTFWSHDAVVLDLTGAVDRSYQIGNSAARARIQLDTLTYMRALAGRADNVPHTVLDGDVTLAGRAVNARAPF
jgi:uncharacterized protein (TIGR03083 family)